MKKTVLFLLSVCCMQMAKSQTLPRDSANINKAKTIWVSPDPAGKELLLKFDTGSKYKIVITQRKKNFKPDAYTWYKRISLVKSFDSQSDKTAAASLSLVYPKGGESSQNFGFGLGVNVLSDTAWSGSQLQPFISWQKNTLSTKKQDVITSGFNYQVRIPRFSKTSPFQIFLISSLNYKNDRNKHTEGMQGSLYFAPVFDGKAGKWYFLPDAKMKSGLLNLIYNLYAGLELENAYQTKNAIDKGHADRYYFRALATASILPGPLDDRLLFSADYVYRTNFSNTIASENNVNKLLKYSIGVTLLKQSSSGFADVSVGYDLQNGVDPAAGYQDQQVGTVALKIKITPQKK